MLEKRNPSRYKWRNLVCAYTSQAAGREGSPLIMWVNLIGSRCLIFKPFDFWGLTVVSFQRVQDDFLLCIHVSDEMKLTGCKKVVGGMLREKIITC